MSATSKLSEFYGSVFKHSARFAISPYRATFKGAAGAGINGDNFGAAALTGFIACVALTIVPVLPVFTAVTFSLAVGGAFLAAASAFLTFPVAWAIDGVSACIGQDDRSSDFGPGYGTI